MESRSASIKPQPAGSGTEAGTSRVRQLFPAGARPPRFRVLTWVSPPRHRQKENPLNAKKPVVTVALAAAGLVLTAGTASAATASPARISGHEQLRSGIQAAIQALPAH